MPDEPGGPNFSDPDLISIQWFGSLHYDGSTYISAPVPTSGYSCTPGFVPEAMPIWEPCLASSPNNSGHHYADTIDTAYEYVTSGNGSTPLDNGGQLAVLTGSP